MCACVVRVHIIIITIVYVLWVCVRVQCVLCERECAFCVCISVHECGGCVHDANFVVYNGVL